ncbi:metal-dependent transcriptional regulator [Treponema phagedenis]|uniref:Transcriptional regulator MntR n=1 Tax=Treponema phagedenis TaxID=162 RepID=A0A0B7GQN4_TREPH|nr:metal-dependent transcriptional regulator [Treponema phagedenis]QSH98622.1 metal-dependent transcriptional regulator [Treponema phagedenis]CEM60753.1 Iron dependent repressor DNA binding domain protein [Treponema phagedenis]
MSILSEITTENYLKTIVKALALPEKKLITTGELSRLMGVTPGTATAMIKRLEKEGYLEYKSHYGCSLTKKGEEFGVAILRRHRLLETFLTAVLHMNDEEVHAEAERLEHAVSDTLIDRIDSYLGFPAVDPHGAPIPQKNQKTYQLSGIRLASAPEGIPLQVLSLEKSPELTAYFRKINLEQGSMLQIKGKNEAIGLAELIINKKTTECALCMLDKIIVSVPEKQ